MFNLNVNLINLIKSNKSKIKKSIKNIQLKKITCNINVCKKISKIFNKIYI